MTYQQAMEAVTQMTGTRKEKASLFLTFANMQQDEAKLQTYLDLAVREVEQAQFAQDERERAAPWIQETLAKRSQIPGYLSR